MKNHVAVAVTMASFLLMACGGGSGAGKGSGSCGTSPSCGGTLDGTWRIASTCVQGDLDAALAAVSNNGAAVPASCNGLFQGFTLDALGTVTFASGQETDHVMLVVNGNAVYTSACVSALTGTSATLTSSTCTTMQSELTSAGAYDSVSCSFTGGNCVCKLVRTQVESTSPGSYTVSPGTITYTDTSKPPVQYCVTGSTLTLEQSIALSGVSTVTVLDKM